MSLRPCCAGLWSGAHVLSFWLQFLAPLPLGGRCNQQPGKQSPAIVSGSLRTWFEMPATLKGKAFLRHLQARLSRSVGPYAVYCLLPPSFIVPHLCFPCPTPFLRAWVCCLFCFGLFAAWNPFPSPWPDMTTYITPLDRATLKQFIALCLLKSST